MLVRGPRGRGAGGGGDSSGTAGSWMWGQQAVGSGASWQQAANCGMWGQLHANLLARALQTDLEDRLYCSSGCFARVPRVIEFITLQ